MTEFRNKDDFQSWLNDVRDSGMRQLNADNLGLKYFEWQDDGGDANAFVYDHGTWWQGWQVYEGGTWLAYKDRLSDRTIVFTLPDGTETDARGMTSFFLDPVPDKTINELIPPQVKALRLEPTDVLILSNWGDELPSDADTDRIKDALSPEGQYVVFFRQDVKFTVLKKGETYEDG